MSKFPDYSELQFEVTRSRGPGGQNVNKTNSAVQLRWKIADSWLPEPIKERLLLKLGSQLTNEGELLVRSDEFRDQEQNKKRVIEKLREIIDKALFVPKKRIKTKPGKSAVRRRLDTKKKHSDKKRSRQGQWD